MTDKTLDELRLGGENARERLYELRNLLMSLDFRGNGNTQNSGRA